MADRNGYIGRAPGDSSVIVATQVYQPTTTTSSFTFSSGYVVGYLDVYLNGARLVNVFDYTATDGSTISLNSAAENGDVVEVIAYKAFNAVTIDTAPGNLSVGSNLTVGGYISAGGSITGSVFYGEVDAAAFDTNASGVVITGVATATSFVGNLTGNVTGNVSGNVTGDLTGTATTATNATNITLADESSDTTCFPVFSTSPTGNQAPKTDSDNLTYNAATGTLVAAKHQATNIVADTTMKVGSATTSSSLYVVGNSASNIVGLASQTTSFAPDFSLGNNFSFVIGGNITLNNPTGVTTGQSGTIIITQDGTGSRTLAFQSYWMFASGTAPTITPGAGTTSILTYFVKDYNSIITLPVLALAGS